MTTIDQEVQERFDAAPTAPQDAGASNLDGAKWGFDLVCATTQDSINATMKEFLASYQGKEFTACYTFDSASGEKVFTPLSDIVAAIGGDPFSIPNGAGLDNPMLEKLYKVCQFVFGFRAKMGLPQGVAPAAIPDVIRLDKGSSLVSYQLFCSEFSVLTLENNFGDLQFTNLAQSASDPWIFLFEVDLDMRKEDQDAFNNLPPSVQNTLKNLNPDSMFSVQQLYLDLNSAGLQELPTIEGLDPSSDAYVYLTKSFINEYWLNLPPSGVLLGYSVLPVTPNPNPSSPSIIPTDLNIQVSPYVDASGNPTTDYGQYTLNYLVMSGGAPMPAFAPFEWNWVEQSQAADFDGTMTVRRDIFGTFLQNLVTSGSQNLIVNTTAECTHSGEDFTTQVSYQFSPTPAQWTLVAAGTPTGPDGFAPLLTTGYSKDSYDSSEDALHTSSINATFNYNMNGGIAVSGNVVRLTVHSVAYMEFNWHLLGINAGNYNANIVDYQAVQDYTLSVDVLGGLVATPSAPVTTDNSQDIDESGWDKFVGLGDIADMVRDIKGKLLPAVQSATTGYESFIAAMLNSSGSWVYPGGKTFAFKQVVFSDYQDLVTHVTYVDPS